MKSRKKDKKLIWFGRAFCIFYALFLMLFSLDVFQQGGNLPAQLGGFLIHSVPSLLLFAILFLTWNSPLRTGFLLLIYGLGFMAFSILSHRQSQSETAYLLTRLLVFLPALLIGVVFIYAVWHKTRVN
ncbi:MAG: hypothetical protein LLG09_04320 [Negativicutes bacterium]|nr:hypothetical protein [Negativicutes bacterium]